MLGRPRPANIAYRRSVPSAMQFPRLSTLHAWRNACLGTIRLIHPFPAATVVVTSGVLLAVAHRGIPEAGMFLRALGTVAASQVAVGALNDYVDRTSDAEGQP